VRGGDCLQLRHYVFGAPSAAEEQNEEELRAALRATLLP
jgi:hypothetical protein